MLLQKFVFDPGHEGRHNEDVDEGPPVAANDSDRVGTSPAETLPTPGQQKPLVTLNHFFKTFLFISQLFLQTNFGH